MPYHSHGSINFLSNKSTHDGHLHTAWMWLHLLLPPRYCVNITEKKTLVAPFEEVLLALTLIFVPTLLHCRFPPSHLLFYFIPVYRSSGWFKTTLCFKRIAGVCMFAHLLSIKKAVTASTVNLFVSTWQWAWWSLDQIQKLFLKKEGVISKCHLRGVWRIRSLVDHVIRTGALSWAAQGRTRTPPLLCWTLTVYELLQRTPFDTHTHTFIITEPRYCTHSHQCRSQCQPRLTQWCMTVVFFFPCSHIWLDVLIVSGKHVYT